MKHLPPELLIEVVAALRERRSARVLGPRVNIYGDGTCRWDLDGSYTAHTRRAQEPVAPDPKDYGLGEDTKFLQDYETWEAECARVRPWAVTFAGGTHYFDTEAEAAQAVDDDYRAHGFILIDEEHLQ